MAATINTIDASGSLFVLGETLRPLLTNTMGSAIEIFDTAGPAGAGPPPHTHPWEEVYVVLDGELEVLVDGESHVLEPGGVAHVPAGTTHGYRNVTDAHFLTIVTRGNATEFFTEVSRDVEMSPPDIPGIVTRGRQPRHRLRPVTTRRPYVSHKRKAQAAATREAILAAFAEQLSDPTRATLSPSEAARCAGVSVRTVHVHFPNRDSQIVAVGEWFDRHFYPSGVRVAEGPDDLARYFREIHANALQVPLTRALTSATSPVGREVRQRRRAARLDAIRHAVAAIGAPAHATEDATAMLLSLSGADASWPLHDTYGLPLERIPDVIANTVQLIVDQLKTQAAPTNHAPPVAESPPLSMSNGQHQ